MEMIAFLRFASVIIFIVAISEQTSIVGGAPDAASSGSEAGNVPVAVPLSVATSRRSVNEEIPGPFSDGGTSTMGGQRNMRRRKSRRAKNNKNAKRLNNLHHRRSKKLSNMKHKGSPENDDPKHILRETMRQMFGFEHMVTTPEMTRENSPNIADVDQIVPEFDIHNADQDIDVEDIMNSASAAKSATMPDPPDFMLELYRTYSEDKSLMLLHSRSQGNTVRSFFPSSVDSRLRDTGRGKPVTITPIRSSRSESNTDGGFDEFGQIPVYIFNLSSIPSPETLVDAEVRLDGYRNRSPVYSTGRKFPNMAHKVRSNSNIVDDDSTRNDNTEFRQPSEIVEANSHSPGDKNNTVLMWNMLAAVYRLERIKCDKEHTCEGQESEIFNRVGRTTVVQSPTISSWSAEDLVRLASRARKTGHVMIVKFQKGSIRSEAEERDYQESFSRQSRQAAREREQRSANSISLDLPKAFFVIDIERQKRNSDSKRNKSYASHFRSTASSPFRLSESGSEWFDADFDTSSIPIFIVYCNDSRTAVTNEAPSTAPIIWGALENMTTSINRRIRRSAEAESVAAASVSDLEDNNFPGENDLSEKDLENKSGHRQNPFVVEKAKDDVKQNQSKKSRNSIDGDRPRPEKGRPNKRNREKGKRRNRRCDEKRGRMKKNCKKNNRRNKNIKPHNSIINENRDDAACGRKFLPVDFGDIGWSDWIISPKFFDAYYCTGQCELSQMQGTGTSNHAIIQAVIKAIGVNKDIPAPCCVPEKLMSLSVLFFDEERNVVLKVFPNMSVETCACR